MNYAQQKVCITGIMRSAPAGQRDGWPQKELARIGELIAKIKAAGVTIVQTARESTLVVEGPEPGTRVVYAKSHGIPVMSLRDFLLTVGLEAEGAA